MTGYGSAVQTYDGREITVEIRSVNNRFLDCSVKLPRTFAFAEEPVKQLVKRYISRGKVDVFVSFSAKEDSEVSVTLNRAVLEGYLKAMQTIAADYGVRDDVSVGLLARLPDVLLVEKPKEDEEAAQAAILACAEEALGRFNAMRETEGRTLAGDLLAKSAQIRADVEKIEAQSPQTVAAYRERLRSKLEEVLQSTNIDESRILTEAAIYADKVAVDEETVRLRSHLAQLEEMLQTDGSLGKKPDFLMQEMGREANTIGSKCSDLAVTKIVLDIKGELEKIREQIQNIE